MWSSRRRVARTVSTHRRCNSEVTFPLAFFHGRNALHRVIPVTGRRPRINSVLTYGEVPDMRLNDLTSKLFYGRTSC